MWWWVECVALNNNKLLYLSILSKVFWFFELLVNIYEYFLFSNHGCKSDNIDQIFANDSNFGEECFVLKINFLETIQGFGTWGSWTAVVIAAWGFVVTWILLIYALIFHELNILILSFLGCQYFVQGFFQYIEHITFSWFS
jgi:hypothetical protein